MRQLRLIPVLVLLLASAVVAGTPGTFRGTVVDGPDKEKEKASGHWIFVKGRNGSLRKVEISKAKVSYSASVPKAKRNAIPEIDVTTGAEVRVTAEQDAQGEWRASRIELLSGEEDQLEQALPPGHPPIDPERGANSKI